MKKEALLAKYRIKDEGVGFEALKLLGATPRSYNIPVNGNNCKVIVSEQLGVVHVSASICLSNVTARVPTYAECLIIKETLFEKKENLIFGISKNPFMNYTISNPFCIHMYVYDGKIPPIEKVIDIEAYKKDGDYQIAEGKFGDWYFVKICGKYFPDMDELKRLKEKYSPQRDVAIVLRKDAIVMLNNYKDGIVFNKMILK